MKKRTTEADLTIISRLIETKMSNAEIAEILGTSESHVKRYASAIRSIMDNKPVNVHPATFNFELVKQWAEKNGFKEPVNVHPICTGESVQEEKTEIVKKADTEIYHRLANDINFIAISLHELAEFILVNFAEGGGKG